jgi:carbohydrate-selective porin OprB
MALKPDFQYIVNPGGMGLEDAKVVTLRGEIAF